MTTREVPHACVPLLRFKPFVPTPAEERHLAQIMKKVPGYLAMMEDFGTMLCNIARSEQRARDRGTWF